MAVTIRKNDSRATVLFLLSFLIHILAISFYLPLIFFYNFRFWGVLGFSLVINGAISAGIWVGYRWVKVLFVALAAWKVYDFLSSISVSTKPADAMALNGLSSALEVLAAVIVVKDLLRRSVQEETLTSN